jgi:hypothetical protein
MDCTTEMRVGTEHVNGHNALGSPTFHSTHSATHSAMNSFATSSATIAATQLPTGYFWFGEYSWFITGARGVVT